MSNTRSATVESRNVFTKNITCKSTDLPSTWYVRQEEEPHVCEHCKFQVGDFLWWVSTNHGESRTDCSLCGLATQNDQFVETGHESGKKVTSSELR